MSNNLRQAKKDLKAFAKRAKDVKYTESLLFSYLITGMITFSIGLNTSSNVLYERLNKELVMSADKTRTAIKKKKKANEEAIEDLNLELIQLMEQGDQVVKSKWASWQFGSNTFLESKNGIYKGRGDKAPKYLFNGIYTRGDWRARNAMSLSSGRRTGREPLTPGNESLNSWKALDSSEDNMAEVLRDRAINASTNGSRSWGLVRLRELQEPVNEIEILARISPKEVLKQPITLSISEPVVANLNAPEVNPQINTPLNAPVIKLPTIEPVSINKLTINAPGTPTAPGAPTITIGIGAPDAPGTPTAPDAPSVPTITVNPSSPGSVTAPTIKINVTIPTISALNIVTPGSVGTINVAAPNVVPVDFTLSPAGLSGGDRKFQNRDYNMKNVSSIDVNSNNYISTWGYVKGLGNITPNVNVNIQDTRAFMVDEGIDEKNTAYAPFKYTGTINLNKSKNVGIDVQGTHTSYSSGSLVNTDSKYNDIKTVANIKVTNAGTIIGNGGAGIKNQVAFGFNNFDTSTNNTRTEMINEGNISLNAEESAGIQLRPENPNADGNTSNTRGLNMMTAYNAPTGKIDINNTGSFGMLTVKNKDNSGNLAAPKTYSNYGITTLPGGQIASRAQKDNMSYMKNTGTINVAGNSSIGIGHLHNIQGVYAGGTINVTGNSSVGVYTEVPTRPVKVGYKDDHGLTNTSGKTVGTETVEVSGNITVSGTGSSGVYATKTGSITLKDNRTNTDADADNRTLGKINVTGTKSYGAVLEGVKLDLEENTEINVTGKESIGYVLKKGTGSNKGKIEVTGPATNIATTPSLGFYGNQGTFTNEEEGKIYSSGTVAHAVALAGDTTGITFNNKGEIKTAGAGNIGVYADGKYTFNHSGNHAVINVGTDTVGIYAKNADGTLNIKAPINIANSGTGTSIGIYSDGNAKVKFGDNSKLTIGEGAVGLYSSDATKFNNTFEIETGKKLTVELGKNSTFALLNGNKSVTTSPLLSKYLNNGTTDKINITSFGEGASIFYATLKANAILDTDYTVTNGDADSTSVLVANDGANIEIANGKTLTTNTNVGLIATGGARVSGAVPVAENKGTLVSTRTDKGIGIYATYATGKNSGTITMNNKNAVGMLATIGSNLINTNKIELKGVSSAGIYGENSNLTNSGTASKIIVNKAASAGMYAKMTGASSTAKTSKNEGEIKVIADGDGKSAAMYSRMESGSTAKLTTENTGTIEVAQTGSAGIFADNQSNGQSEVLNSGLVKMTGIKSVGIIGKKSKVTNSGTGTNGIEISGTGSAGILATDESEVINSGRIEGSTGTDLVGISVDKTSTVENSGTITMNTDSNTGIASKGGEVTNEGEITLKGIKSTGISSENGDVTNSGTGTKGIKVKNEKSVGIYAKLTGNDDKTVSNTGTISLETPTGLTPEKSAAIYSLIDSGTGKLTTENNGTINVDQKNSVGIFAQNNTRDKSKSVAKNIKTINVSKEGSAGILGEKSTITNSGAGTDGIVLTAIKTAGIIGNKDSKVSNAGRIETTGITPADATEGLVGISLNVSTGTNETGGTITLGTDFSTGMYGKAASTLTNYGTITGNNKHAVGMAADASTATNETTGTITLNGVNSTGMFGESAAKLINKNTIDGNAVGAVGMAVNASTAENNNGATINLIANNSTGIFGKAASTVTNAGTIDMKTAVPSKIEEGLVGIALDASTGTNTSDGKIKIGTAYSTGMFGTAGSTATNEGSITGDKLKAVGMAGNASTVTNKHIITLDGKNSTGMFGTASSTLLNDEGATITVKEEESVGIYSKENVKLAQNKGTILTEKKKSAGMLGNEGSLENENSITTKEEESAGMYVENATAANKKTITAEGKASAGIYVKLDKAVGGTISGTNEGSNAVITMEKEGSAGMLGFVDSKVADPSAKLTLTNQNSIVINSTASAGMMVTNNAAAVPVSNVKAVNTGIIDLNSTVTKAENIGILANQRATGINEKIINVNSESSVGMSAKEGSNIENNTSSGTINLKAESGIGMLADGKDASGNISTATNNAKIIAVSTGIKSLGMLAQNHGKAENKKTIEILSQQGVGIFISETGTGKNTSDGTITLENTEAVGIFAKNNGSTYTAENAGSIVLGKADGLTNKISLIGMFGQAESGKTASIKNTGTIDINTSKSVGMYAKNDPANSVTAVDLHNAETININNAESAGIYAPKANVSKVGKINLKDSDITNGSSAVYISEGGKVSDTDTAEISLGTVNQNRVAYYVNGAGSTLAGTNIGKITGYGVGVYLQGNGSSDKAEIDGNTPTLDYKASGANGNGIIGLYLSGDTDIQAYTKGITVGDSVDTKYAIGIYSNKQGIPGIPYSITTPIQAGANGVGIYSDKDSNIKYTGDMEIGDGATAGIGIFITKKEGANGGKVELASNTIKLKGTGGVAVIASEGTVFDGKNATIELLGTNVQGVGVYAKKGSEVNVDNWHFKNYGNSAEEVRSEEGIAKITAPVKQLNPKMVLTHVINGETYIANGSKVMSVNDGSIAATSNIGLMVEGLKNPTAPAPLTWQEGNFEIANHGTIDFSIAEKSTAIFSNSARALNDGTIKVGENSTAIYGFYDENTRKYDGSTLNKLEIETSANSKISLGNGSTGMYLINAEKVENKGGEITADTGAAKNVGIYVVNGQDSNSNNNKNLTMTTAANITLGDGSVGIYSKGKSVSSKNTVTNTGNITIGNQLTAASGKSPAVAVYAENTKFDNDSKVRVGENGIAFYGKNSEITAKNSVDFSNKGVLAYLENSKFVSYLGDLDTKNTMIYAKDSDVTLLDSSMNKVKVTVHDGVTGAYIEGKSTLNGVGEIVLGEKSTGLFLKNTQPNFISSTELISGTKKEARGIISMDSNLTNNSKISLTGEDSVGIYSNANTFKTVVNNGKLTLSGKKTLGVFLRGVQSFKNTADIDIADSLNSLEPTIGIYTAEGSSSINHASGKIEVGKKSIGIYSKTDSDVEIESGKIHVKDEAIGIYKEKGKVVLKGELNVDKHTSTVVNTEPVGVYAVNGTEIDDQSSKVTIGEKSYGFILNNTDLSKTNIYRNDNSGTVTMENDSVFLYSSGKADINNKRSINGNNSDHLIGFYIKNGGDFVNEGNIDFSNGKGNIGIYAPGGKVTNKAKISVGKTDDVDSLTGKPYTDASKIVYGIGMAADNGGHIINHESGEIRVYGNKSIGMYGSGHGTVVENFGKIYLDGSRATASDKVQSMTGVYIDNGATFVNHKNGLIRTADAYAGRDGKVNKNVNGLVGVAIMNGSTLENYGNILIDAEDSYGVIIRGKRDSNGKLERYAVIKNYGNIKVVGKGAFGINWKDVSQDDINNLKAQIDAKLASDPRGQEIVQASGTDKNFEGVSIVIKNGKPVFSIGGVQIPDSEVEKIEKIMGRESNVSISDVGFYIDTLGRTKPVNFVGVAPPVNSQLIIGTEYSGITNKKQWFLTGDIIKPFLQEIQGRNFKLTTLAGSLTWIATPVLDNHGQLVGVAMKKIPYTSLVERTENSYNFTDGLEQRYDMNELTSIEKRVFVKLNSIGKNEEAVMTQAIDEMMGHQYANVQQRIFETGNLLNKEFGYLRNEWETKSKDSNKIKVFGMKGNYKTDTAGIIDYTNKAYGFAYLNENETIKLGESSGWYAGAVKNKFDFSDIGGSKEEQTMVKAGVYKSKPLGRDHNNGLNWTVAAEGFVGTGDMDRKFLVVDDIFEAKSQYRTYGLGLRNELRKNVRTSERTSISPYGSLRMEYGRFGGIKEDNGQMRLEVKSNDYYSIKPEVGVEFKYRQPMAVRTTFIAKLGLAYENELGKVGDVNNKARVRYTTADWFNIRSEKDDRRGNGKVDLNLGIENTRFGVTVNAGYDTKGENVRGGIGFRAIY